MCVDGRMGTYLEAKAEAVKVVGYDEKGERWAPAHERVAECLHD